MKSTAHSDAMELKHSSLVAVVLLTFVSFGFYLPVWFLRRRRALNSLDSPAKIGLAGPWVLLFLQAVAVPLRGAERVIQQQGQAPPAVLGLLQFAVSIGSLVVFFALVFRVRAAVTDHLGSQIRSILPASRVASDPVQFSLPLTLLFSVAYLQYKINEFLDVSKAWTHAAGETS